MINLWVDELLSERGTKPEKTKNGRRKKKNGKKRIYDKDMAHRTVDRLIHPMANGIP